MWILAGVLIAQSAIDRSHVASLRSTVKALSFPAGVASVSLEAGQLSTLTPGWSGVPAGVTSGGRSIVAVSQGSAQMSRVSGDPFNPNWQNKPVEIDGRLLQIAGCSSASLCTLSAPASYSDTYSYAVVGQPDSLWLTDAAGAGEAVTVLGVGPQECPAGSALSVCVVPAQAHPGPLTLQSATAGLQEAIDSLGPTGGTVLLPAGSYPLHATLLIDRNYVDLSGAGLAASQLQDAVTGSPAAPALLILNHNDVTVEKLRIFGGSQTGNLISVIASQFGMSDIALRDLMLDASQGQGLDAHGLSMPAAGIYLAGTQTSFVVRNKLQYDGYGLFIDNSFPDAASGLQELDAASLYQANDASYNLNDGIFANGLSQGGQLFASNHLMLNGGWGFHANALTGANLTANYFEANHAGQILLDGAPAIGVIISANLISTHGDASSGTALQVSGASSQSISILANAFEVNSPVTTLTSFIDLAGSGITVANNNFVSSGNLTLPEAIRLETSAAHNALFANAAQSAFIHLSQGILDLAHSASYPVDASLLRTDGRGPRIRHIVVPATIVPAGGCSVRRFTWSGVRPGAFIAATPTVLTSFEEDSLLWNAYSIQPNELSLRLCNIGTKILKVYGIGFDFKQNAD